MAELDQELFLQRPGDVLLHIFVDQRGEVCASLQHHTDPERPMESWGLVTASAPPIDCMVVMSSPPGLLIGATMFPLFAEQAREVDAWLQSVPALIERQRSRPSNVLRLVPKDA